MITLMMVMTMMMMMMVTMTMTMTMTIMMMMMMMMMMMALSKVNRIRGTQRGMFSKTLGMALYCSNTLFSAFKGEYVKANSNLIFSDLSAEYFFSPEFTM